MMDECIQYKLRSGFSNWQGFLLSNLLLQATSSALFWIGYVFAQKERFFEAIQLMARNFELQMCLHGQGVGNV